MCFKFSINVPLFLGRICLWIYLRYKKIRYGCKFRYILLNRGRFVIVEQADYDKLMQHNWFVKTSPDYAVRRVKGKTIYMHNEIMEPSPGFIVDHKDRHSLNNSRSNLRLATKHQNSYNQKKRRGQTSKYKGVYRNQWGSWRAKIRFDGKIVYLGSYKNEIDAAKAYDKAAMLYHKEFAVLNFPNDPQIKTVA